MPLRHPQHAGIFVVAQHQPNRQAILSRLEWFFATVHPPYANKVCIIRDYFCRMKTFTIRALSASILLAHNLPRTLTLESDLLPRG